MDFQLNVLEKAYFIARKCGLAMVRPVSSVFWKMPRDSTQVKKLQREYTVILTYNIFKTTIKCTSK